MKVRSKKFVKYLSSFDLAPLLMVPCSIFKPLSFWLLANQEEIIFPPNEAHAMGFAVGTYCVTGQPAVIFLQNSGLNNIGNAQTSLHALYRIPVLLVVSWRGEKPEAPEHDLMGRHLKEFFKVLQIPFRVLTDKWEDQLKEMIFLAKKKKQPVAVVIRKEFFAEEKPLSVDLRKKYSLSRYEAIEIIKKTLKRQAVFISTNGHPSRDSFAADPTPDFYMMGSMGHVFSIGAGTVWALGQKKPALKIVVLDGDGGCLMHLGSLALVNKVKESNLIYVVLDNEAYESTGSQPSLSPGVDFIQIARGLGFKQVFSAQSAADLRRVLIQIRRGPVFIHLKINRQKKDTPRVSDQFSCKQITQRFRSYLKKVYS